MMAHWAEKGLQEIGEIVTGNTPSKSNKAYYQDGNIDFIKPSDIQHRVIETFSEKLSEKSRGVARIVPSGSVLVTCIGEIGRVGLTNHEVAFNQQINGIIPNGQIDSRFLFYRLQLEKRQLESKASATTVSILNKSKFSTIKITFPKEKDLQEKIVEAIDTQFTRLDAAIKSLKAVKSKLGLYRKSVLKAAFALEDTSVATIEEVNSFIGSGITPKGSKQHYRTEGIPFIRSQNIYPFKFVTDGLVFVNSSLHGEMRRTHTMQGDVLLNITGASIGRCAVIPDSLGQANVNQHVCIIRTKENTLPQYLCAFLNSPLGQNQIMAIQGGVTRQGLNYQQIRKMKLPLPSVAKQKIIIDEIESKYSVIDKVGVIVDASLAKAETLRKSILKTAFTGKLVN